MANMFWNSSEKTIPKNLDECTQNSAVSNNLWSWAARIETWGKVLFWILVVVGLISSIADSIAFNEVTKHSYYSGYYTDEKTTLAWDVFFTEILEWALYAFIEYCTYHVLALLIGALASLVQNTKISADVALFCASKDCADSLENAEAAADTSAADSAAGSSGEGWFCSKCGMKNSNTALYCPACGQYK